MNLQDRRLAPPDSLRSGWFVVTGILEVATGLALVVMPSLVSDILLGQSIAPGAGETIARVAGAALASVGASCWLSRGIGDEDRASPVLGPMLVYNLAVVCILLQGRTTTGTVGIAFWPAIIVHVVMAAWVCRIWHPRRVAS